MHVKAHTSNDDHWAKMNPGFSRNRPRMKRNGRPRSFIWRRGEERREIFFIYTYFVQDSTSIAQVAGVEREKR